MNRSNQGPISDRVLRQEDFARHHGNASPQLLELVCLRVAEIHGSLDAVEKHREQLEKMGETDERLLCVCIWESSDLFDAQERAALAFCEKITVDPGDPLPQCLIEEMLHHFTESETVSLTLAILSVNEWHLSPR